MEDLPGFDVSLCGGSASVAQGKLMSTLLYVEAVSLGGQRKPAPTNKQKKIIGIIPTSLPFTKFCHLPYYQNIQCIIIFFLF